MLSDSLTLLKRNLREKRKRKTFNLALTPSTVLVKNMTPYDGNIISCKM